MEVIKGDGKRILIRCPTRLDSTAYQAVLEGGLQNMYADDSVFCAIRRDLQCYILKRKKIVFLVTDHHSHLISISSKTSNPFCRHVYPNSISRHPIFYGMLS